MGHRILYLIAVAGAAALLIAGLAGCEPERAWPLPPVKPVAEGAI